MRTQQKLREAISAGYAAVAGRAYTDTISAITLGDLAAQQIREIEKDSGPTRLSKLAEVERVKQELTAAVAAAKKMDPSVFSAGSTTQTSAYSPQGAVDPVTGKVRS